MTSHEKQAFRLLVRAYENLISMQEQALRLKYIGANWISDSNLSQARGIIQGAQEVLNELINDTSV